MTHVLEVYIDGERTMKVTTDILPRLGDKFAITEEWESVDGKKYATPVWPTVTEVVFVRECGELICQVYLDEKEIDKAVAFDERLLEHSKKEKAVRELV